MYKKASDLSSSCRYHYHYNHLLHEVQETLFCVLLAYPVGPSAVRLAYVTSLLVIFPVFPQIPGFKQFDSCLVRLLHFS